MIAARERPGFEWYLPFKRRLSIFVICENRANMDVAMTIFDKV
ncbi:MAG: hypothetical protein ACJ789_00450 [Thermomicrobiales bacterium]